MGGDTIVFDTEPGHECALLSGLELSLADFEFVPETRTVGRWRFARRGLRDLSGNGHHARLVGGAAGGQVGLGLDGEGSYAEVDRTATFDFAADESFSVEARVRFLARNPPAMPPSPVAWRRSSIA